MLFKNTKGFLALDFYNMKELELQNVGGLPTVLSTPYVTPAFIIIIIIIIIITTIITKNVLFMAGYEVSLAG